MFVKLLGVMDLVAALMLFLAGYSIGMSVGWIFAIYLLIKGLVFLPSVASIMDFICGVIFVLALFGYGFFFNWVFVLWLLQKGVFSLLN